VSLKQKTLVRFVKDECANFIKHSQTCLAEKPCGVLSGKRCGYFEKRVLVLGSPDYKFRLPDYDYQKLFAQYAEVTNTESKVVKQRLCDCGAPLKHRRRFCDSCSQKKRKVSNRKYNRKRAG
jgi:hypothetical protein